MMRLCLPRSWPTTRLGFSRALTSCAADVTVNMVRDAVKNQPKVLSAYMVQLEVSEKKFKNLEAKIKNLEEEAKLSEAEMKSAQHDTEIERDKYSNMVETGNYNAYFIYRHTLHLRIIFDRFEAKNLGPLEVPLEGTTRLEKWRVFLDQDQNSERRQKLEAALVGLNHNRCDAAMVMVDLSDTLFRNLHFASRMPLEPPLEGEPTRWAEWELGALNSAAMEWICSEYPIHYEVVSAWPDIMLKLPAEMDESV